MKIIRVHASWALLLLGFASLSGCQSATLPPPAPSIISFAANPTITTGGSANLTGVFANGAGIITPGLRW
jgi:hypothetical protein